MLWEVIESGGEGQSFSWRSKGRRGTVVISKIRGDHNLGWSQTSWLPPDKFSKKNLQNKTIYRHGCLKIPDETSSREGVQRGNIVRQELFDGTKSRRWSDGLVVSGGDGVLQQRNQRAWRGVGGGASKLTWRKKYELLSDWWIKICKWGWKNDHPTNCHHYRQAETSS